MSSGERHSSKPEQSKSVVVTRGQLHEHVDFSKTKQKLIRFLHKHDGQPKASTMADSDLVDMHQNNLYPHLNDLEEMGIVGYETDGDARNTKRWYLAVEIVDRIPDSVIEEVEVEVEKEAPRYDTYWDAGADLFGLVVGFASLLTVGAGTWVVDVLTGINGIAGYGALSFWLGAIGVFTIVGTIYRTVEVDSGS